MRRIALLVVGLVLVGGAAAAQDVGTVAVVRGVAEIKRAGTAAAAVVGAGVRVGDELRTGDGKLRVVFQDDSVIDLAERSALVIDEQVFNPSAGQFSSLLNLLVGKARALVSRYYAAAGSTYQVRTPTAVAGVRGTTFLISYDAERDTSEVVGIHGFVQVRNLTADVDEFIYVGAEETTKVTRDAAPTSPQRLDERLFRDEVEGMELSSLGGTSVTQSLAATVAPPERAPMATSPSGQLGRDGLRNIGDVVGEPLDVVDGSRGRLGVPF